MTRRRRHSFHWRLVADLLCISVFGIAFAVALGSWMFA